MNTFTGLLVLFGEHSQKYRFFELTSHGQVDFYKKKKLQPGMDSHVEVNF